MIQVLTYFAQQSQGFSHIIQDHLHWTELGLSENLSAVSNTSRVVHRIWKLVRDKVEEASRLDSREQHHYMYTAIECTDEMCANQRQV